MLIPLVSHGRISLQPFLDNRHEIAIWRGEAVPASTLDLHLMHGTLPLYRAHRKTASAEWCGLFQVAPPSPAAPRGAPVHSPSRLRRPDLRWDGPPPRR